MNLLLHGFDTLQCAYYLHVTGGSGRTASLRMESRYRSLMASEVTRST